MVTTTARGVLYVHSSPRALCPHVEWAAGRAIGRAVNFTWTDQPVLRGSQRTDFYWEGAPGTGAAIASALRGWEHLRFEVTEDPRDGVVGLLPGLLVDDDEDLREASAPGVPGRPPREPLGDRVHEEDSALGVGRDDGVSDTGERPGEPAALLLLAGGGPLLSGHEPG